MAIEIDRATEFGNRVDLRLGSDLVAWLTTVGGSGTPQPAPVWFLWDGAEILVYSRGDAARLRNIAGNPRVAFHLNGDANGGDIVVLTGAARIELDAPPADGVPDYIEKYRSGINEIGTTPDGFARDYSVAVRIAPDRLRGH